MSPEIVNTGNAEVLASPWLESLPDQCPLAGAYEPDGQSFYRKIRNSEAHDDDFKPNQNLKFQPNRSAYNACRALAVSLFSELRALKNKMHIGSLQDCHVAKVTLHRGCGVIMQTGNDHSHFSWWRSRTSLPTQHCEAVTEE